MPQKGLLFSGTIDSNMRIGKPDVDPEAVREAIETAQAADFVFGKPEGLEAEVAQGGTNFSGGQKQRLNRPRAREKSQSTFLTTVFLP